MNPSTLRWLGVSAAAAAAVLCWYLLSAEPDSALRTVGTGMASAAHVSGNLTASKPPEPWPKFGTPEFTSALLGRGQKWLDSRGRDAAGLVAMWDLTDDLDFLTEAENKFPDEPRVWMALIGVSGTETALPWIERLIAAEPANPEGLYHKAWTLVPGGWEFRREDELEASMAILRRAAAMSGRRDDRMGERIQTVREAALSLGVGSGDAVRLALTVPLQHSTTSRILESAINALSGGLALAKAAGSEERLMEIIGIGLLTADKFSDAAMVSDELSANTLQLDLLADLPDDTETGARGRSVRSWKTDVAGRREYLVESDRRKAEATALLETAGDRQMVSYYHCLITHGERAARSSLLPDTEEAK